VLGDCPGCPECADAAEWHDAIMAEPCEGDVHCTCVPVLRMACADRDAQLYRLGDELAEARLEVAKLRTATRKVVEALADIASGELGINIAIKVAKKALADPVIVALGRE
jgi:hypothetical protein